jgi:hypothetical protein
VGGIEEAPQLTAEELQKLKALLNSIQEAHWKQRSS